MPSLRCCLVCLVLLLGATRAGAQDAPALRAHRVVFEGGAVWSGGYAVGDINAELRGNAAGITPPAFTLFTANSDVRRATSVSVRVGFTLTRAVTIEGGAVFGRPRVGVSIAQDAEAAALRLEGEQLQQYLFDTAVVWHLPVRLGPRVRPFVIGGGGYLRQLHEERTLVETGQIYYAGIGARYWLHGGAGAARSFGLRGDLRANLRRGGIDFENKTRVFPTLALNLFVSV
ncbi:MAG: hypothetical protein AB7N29_12310 [Vicinamibacterales bacterium]